MPRLEERIDAAIKLGVEYVRNMPIPPAMARECARRYLLDEARDYERASARRVEEAAEVKRPTPSSITPRVIAPEVRAAMERGRIEGERRAAAAAAFEDWVKAQPAVIFPMPQVHSDAVHTIELWPSSGLRQPSYPPDRPAWVTAYRETRRLFDAGDLEGAAEALVNLATLELQRTRNQHEHERRLWRETIDGAIEKRAAELDIEWTAALLTTTVALPDGTRVLWGEATVEQHQARLDMLSQHAATELATASRHKAAINAIEANPGARCLNDVEAVAA